ncbi:MAG: NAD(P)H-hydrate dehydratase [Novosphingobium sp.]
MPAVPDQVLTVAQMRAAEEALIAAGSSVDKLMQIAGRGAAEWVWRVAAGRSVTVLCGPGNNGGDGYVIAESIRTRGGSVSVIAATDAKTDAARNARALFGGQVTGPDDAAKGEIFVDCLFGSGLTRALSDEHIALLSRLAASHSYRIAIDVPSGVESDSGAMFNAGLPPFDLTVALGAWKQAHFLMPASATMGHLRLVGIGVGQVEGAAALVRQPSLQAPTADAHKYRRGLLGVVAGTMPGAALLSARSAQGAGAGYVKLLDSAPSRVPVDIVSDTRALSASLADKRWSAVLVGPGLGRHAAARDALVEVLAQPVPAVLDADALMLLLPNFVAGRSHPLIATPHEGEFAAMEAAFGLGGEGSKPDRALALAQASGMVIVAKGPDSVIAAPDGRIAFSHRASSWLSTAGTGDVLAGTIASRLASGVAPFEAACQGVWLHGEAARLAGAAFTAGKLAESVGAAYAACL